MIAIFLVSDILIAYYVIIRNFFVKKGTYSIEEMTGVTITYYEYDKVICK